MKRLILFPLMMACTLHGYYLGMNFDLPGDVAFELCTYAAVHDVKGNPFALKDTIKTRIILEIPFCELDTYGFHMDCQGDEDLCLEK